MAVEQIRTPIRRVAIVGQGGREDAMAWRVRKDLPDGDIFVIPGNGGTFRHATPVDSIDPRNIDAVVGFARDNKVDLLIPGSDLYLGEGLTDLAQTEKLLVFGPTQNAFRIESDKIWQDEFMKRQRIPHPHSSVIRRVEHAIGHARSISPSEYVIKDPRLRGGKGVSLPKTHEEAETIMRYLLEVEKVEGILIQERLKGQEASVIVISNGEQVVVSFPPAADYKTLYDNNEGPNTGGMGTYAPVPISIISQQMRICINREIIVPAVRGMNEEGNPFIGFLFANIMLTDKGPMVLEFNGRMGDSEAEALMPITHGNFLQTLVQAARGEIPSERLSFRGSAVCIVMASEGYPDAPITGRQIFGEETLSNYPNTLLFHAGTSRGSDGRLITSSGRVGMLVGHGSNLSIARRRAYAPIGEHGLHFDNMHTRSDIAKNVA